MKSRDQSQGPWKFLAAVIGLTAFAIAMTVIVAYFVTSPPREFMFWVWVGFLCTIEFLLGILYVNTFARDRCEYRPSGATLAITYGIVAAFAVSGFISIFAYWAIRDEQGSSDIVFSGVLMALIVFWFVIAFFLYAYDLHSQSVLRPAQKKRTEHQGLSRNLKQFLYALHEVKTDSDIIRKRIETIIKKAEMAETALAHSHGGGSGSWESNQPNLINPERNQVILNSINSLNSIVPKLSQSLSENHETVFEELEQYIGQISLALEAQGLC